MAVQFEHRRQEKKESSVNNNQNIRNHNINNWVTRIIDVSFSILILLFTLPIMILIAIVIKIDSPGPVIFRHTRVGINRRRKRNINNNVSEKRQDNLYGRQYILYKFRTMYVDARERFPELYKYDFTEEQLVSLPMKVLMASSRGSANNCDGIDKGLGCDPRLTRVGRWLRRTSLDELPNFINVIRGEMSLVGPRPDIASNVSNYKLEHMDKFNVKPGVTGLSQVKGRGMLSFHQTNKFDIYYIHNRCFTLDVKILFRTIFVALRGIGSY